MTGNTDVIFQQPTISSSIHEDLLVSGTPENHARDISWQTLHYVSTLISDLKKKSVAAATLQHTVYSLASLDTRILLLTVPAVQSAATVWRESTLSLIFPFWAIYPTNTATVKEIKSTHDPPVIQDIITINSNDGKELKITLLQNLHIQMDRKSQNPFVFLQLLKVLG